MSCFFSAASPGHPLHEILVPRAMPLEALKFLLDQHSLLQKDLAGVFGTPSIVSEVLSGKRELNKDHIKRLSRRFHVSPELFF